MAITVRYGNYVHPAGEVEYSYQVVGQVSDRGIPARHDYTIELNGLLMADDTAAMDLKVVALREAYLKHNQDFFVVSGSSPLDISVLAENTLDGIRVSGPPSFPTNRNSAYVTVLPYRIRLEWSQAILDEEFALRSFNETLSFSGGGRRRKLIETARELPQAQIVRRNTIFRATQQGQATGFYRIPVAPWPIWPALRVEENPEYSLGSGTTLGPIGSPQRTDIPVTWRYNFESATALVATPNIWGVTQ